MAITRRLASGLWLILTIAADHASAQVLLRDMGGSTGGQFTDTCPTDQNLAGVELRGGEWVDAIRAVCVKAFGPDNVAAPILTTGSGLVSRQMAVLGTVIDVPEVAPGWNGGPGGRIVQLLCPLKGLSKSTTSPPAQQSAAKNAALDSCMSRDGPLVRSGKSSHLTDERS